MMVEVSEGQSNFLVSHHSLVSISWISFNVLMNVQITPIALENIYYRFYIILAVLNTCNAVVLWFLYPETKRLTLEELDFYFANKYGYDAATKNVGLESAEKGGTDEVKVNPAN